MPQDYYSPYQEAAAGFDRLGQVLPQIAYGMQRRRYQQDLMRYQMDLKQRELASQMAVDRERVNLLRQQARNEDFQTRQLEQQTGAANAFGEALAGFSQYGVPPVGREEGPFENTARMANQNQMLQQAIRQAAILSGGGRQHAFKNLAEGSVMGDSRMRELIATDTPAVSNVPAEATQIDNATGVPMYYSDREIGRGVNLVDPQTGVTRAQGQPYAPGSNLGALIGSLTRLRGQGMFQGIPLDPNNPMFQQAETGISQLLPQVLKQAGVTNQGAMTGQGGIPNLGTVPQQGQSVRDMQLVPAIDKAMARQEAMQLMKQHPTKAEAIKKRYRETFNEELK